MAWNLHGDPEWEEADWGGGPLPNTQLYELCPETKLTGKPYLILDGGRPVGEYDSREEAETEVREAEEHGVCLVVMSLSDYHAMLRVAGL
jgi:hypothetical protein